MALTQSHKVHVQGGSNCNHTTTLNNPHGSVPLRRSGNGCRNQVPVEETTWKKIGIPVAHNNDNGGEDELKVSAKAEGNKETTTHQTERKSAHQKPKKGDFSFWK